MYFFILLFVQPISLEDIFFRISIFVPKTSQNHLLLWAVYSYDNAYKSNDLEGLQDENESSKEYTL